MKPPKRPRNAPRKVLHQPGPAKKLKKGKEIPLGPVPSTRGAALPSSSDMDVRRSQNKQRTVDNVPVYRTVTASNLSVAHGPMIQEETPQESPRRNEENILESSRGISDPMTSHPVPSGLQRSSNNNLGMLNVSNQFDLQGSGAFSSSFDTRLQHVQADQFPSHIASVFDPISSHIPVKFKEKIWKDEFIDLNILLKSTRDLVNEQNLEAELAVKGGVLSIVNQKRSPIKSIYVWTSAFMIYVSVMLEKRPNKGFEFFKYMQTVRVAASRDYSGGLVQYDEQF
ncbi:unnamed protein product [Mytilus coruscus]|uniref:Uncharacterized protein n=1 Tax=Mytilus coruscus TaxID=42192 RepID=A0A6J8E6E4_MYTCO|nr:unnamed protein product [Mytilus coruscus]